MRRAALLFVLVLVLVLDPSPAFASASAAGGDHYHGLDVRALGVQLLGFTILAIILARYAVPPLAAALRARRERIRQGFAELEAEERTLTTGKAQAEAKLKDADRTAGERLERAFREGAELRDTLVREGEEAALKVGKKAKVEVEIERQKVRLALRNEVVSLSFRAAEGVLREAVDRATQDRLVDEFLAELDAVRPATAAAGRN
jgi:F-type H+-transporting ATPase subunit b